MALTVNTNIASLQAQDALDRSSNNLTTALQRLSTGLKINRGADDPAGLVISQHQLAQISGLQAAISNTTNAVSVVQTGEGALSEINNLLVQVRGLAINAANAGVNDTNSLAADQAQITNALQTIDNIAKNTQFGTKHLLDGSAGTAGAVNGVNNASVGTITTNGSTTAGTYTVQITTQGTGGTLTGSAAGAGTLTANGSITISGGGLSSSLTVGLLASDDINSAATKIQQALDGATGINGGPGKFSVSVNGSTKLVISSNILGSAAVTAQTDSATTKAALGVNNAAAETGTAGTALAGTINGVAATVSAGSNGLNNVLTAGSNAGGADGLAATIGVTAGATAANGSTTSINVTGEALVFQIGANENQTASISIQNVASSNLGLNVAGLNNPATTSLSKIDVTTTNGAQDAIAVVDQAINDISNLRGTLGAFQANTLQATAANLQTTLENTTSAESNIADTNFAAETATYTQNQVLVQAGTTVLANANQTSGLVLNLLK